MCPKGRHRPNAPEEIHISVAQTKCCATFRPLHSSHQLGQTKFRTISAAVSMGKHVFFCSREPWRPRRPDAPACTSQPLSCRAPSTCTSAASVKRSNPTPAPTVLKDAPRYRLPVRTPKIGSSPSNNSPHSFLSKKGQPLGCPSL